MIFDWSVGSATSYRLILGSSLGGSDIYDSKATKLTAVTATSLPNDGRTIYVRLSSRVAQQWSFIDYTYSAFKFQPGFTSIARLATGDTLLKGIGAANQNYTIHWSPGLSSPTQALATIKTDSKGSFQYDDSNSRAVLNRFYSLSSP